MLAVKGVYDGKKLEIQEKVNIPEGKPQEVIITFLNEEVRLEPFDLNEFLKGWSSEEINAIDQIFNTRKSFFDGRRFDL